MSKKGERIFTLRAAALAMIAGAALYVVAIFVILALKLVPTATDLQHHTENLKVELDLIHGRALALDAALEEARRLLLRETGTSGAPAPNAASDIRAKVQTRFESAAASPDNIPDRMRAAIAGAADSQSEMKLALIEALSYLETRRYDDAAARLNQIDALNKVAAERLADVQSLGLADLIERQKSLGAAADLSLRSLVWWSAGAGALLPLIALFFYRRFYRPLMEFETGLERVAGGDLTARVEVRRKDEMGRLGAHFNRMNEMLGERAEEERRPALDLIERFGLTLDESSNEIYIFDARDLRFVQVNRGARENLGYSREEFSRMTPLDLMPDYDRESFAELVRPLLDGEQERVAASALHLRKDGSSYPVEVNFRLLSLEEPTVFVAIIQDISEQRRAMESLRESRRKYETLVDSINGIVWEGDPQTFRFSFVSQKAESILGYPVERWITEPGFWSEHLHPDDRQWALDYCTKASAENSDHQFEYRMVAADGREVWLRDIVNIEVGDDGTKKARGVMIDITESKRAEEALQLSEHKYKTIFEYAPVGIYQSSPDGAILTANRALAEMLGYASVEEMLAANLAEDIYLNEEERRKLISRYEPAGQVSGLELQWKKKDGTPIWVSLNVHAIKDQENRSQYFEGFVRDVTERRRAEEALRASEELFSKAFHASPVEMSITRLRDGICLDMNDIALQDTGYTREDVVGKKTGDLELFADPDDPNRVRRFIEDRRPFRNLEFRTRRKNGEVRVNLTSAEIIEFGGEECLLLATNDITRRKHMEEALERSQELFSKAFHASPVEMTIIRLKDGCYIDMNESALHRTGYSRKEVIGRPANALYLLSDPENPGQEKQLIEARRPFRNLEVRSRRKNGEVRVNLMSAEIIELGGDECLLLVVNDITERKRAEEALRQNEELLNNIINNSTAVIYVKDIEGRYLLVNKQYETLFRITLSDVRGKTDHELFPKEFADVYRANDLQIIEARSTLESEEVVPQPDGLHTYISIKFPLFDPSGDIYATCGISTDITERKRAEEALRASEERFSKAFYNSPNAHSILRLSDNRFIDTNESVVRMTGYSREEIIGRTPKELNYWVDLKDRDEVLKRLKDQQPISDMEIQFRTRSGEARYGLFSAEIIELEGEACLLTTTNDITERKQAEEATSRLVAILDATTDFVGTADTQGKALYVNRAGRIMIGLDENADISKTSIPDYHPRWASEIIINEAIPAAIRDGVWSGETALLHRDGEEITISQVVIAHKNKRGEVEFLSTVARDITERKRVEEALRISERKYKDIFEFAPVGIYQSSLDGTIMTANQALARMLGYESADDLMKVNLAKDVYLNEEERRKLIREYEPTGFAMALELEWKKKDGAPILISLNAHTIKDIEGRTQCFEGFVRDITESKKAEEALRASEELFSKAFHASPVEMTILRLKDGICLDMNEIALQGASYTREEIIGRPASEFSLLADPEDRDRIRQVIEQGGMVRNFEVKSLRRNGEVRVNLLSAEILDLGGEPCLLVVVNDITRRKRAEEALRASEERFSKAFNASPDPMSIVTLDEGRFIDVNEMFLRITGYKREEVIGSTVLGIGIWARPEAQEQVARLLREQGFVHDLEADFRAKNGELRTHVFSAEIIDLDGEKCVLGQSSDVTERKRAEEAVRQQREWLRVTLASIGDAVITTDTAGRVTFMNPVAETVTGWKEEEAVGGRLEKIFNIISEETREPVENPVEKVMKEGMIVGLANHTLLIARDGREIPIDDSGAPIKDEQRNIRGVVLVFHDITERRKTEKALQASEERFSKAFQASPLPMSIGKDLRFIDVNNSFLRNSGYTREEIIGQSALELGMFSDLDELHKMRRLISEQGSVSNLEMTLRMKNGEARPHLISAEPIEIGGEQCILMVGNDITERKRAEEEQARLQEAIRESAREWRLTFDAVESLIMILDMQGNVLRLNRAAKEISGSDYRENIGIAVELIGKGQPWQKAAELALAVRSARQATSAQVKDDITGRTWDIAASLFTGPEVEEERIIVVARDITRMVQLQESLRRSETLYAMGKLVAGVAHEVRNPLFGISATLDAFDVRFGDREEYKRYTTILRGEANRLSQLMQELLDYGKPTSLDISEDSIESVMTEVVKACRPLAEKAKVRLAGKSAGEFTPILMDRKRIVQVFRNLVENAIQHSPAGGIVEIEAKDVWDGERRWVECAVRDSGKGLKEEDISRIFDPFFTKRKGGTGLGLSIVQRIVEEHNGKVFARNRPEGGTVLTVRLPLTRS